MGRGYLGREYLSVIVDFVLGEGANKPLLEEVLDRKLSRKDLYRINKEIFNRGLTEGGYYFFDFIYVDVKNMAKFLNVSTEFIYKDKSISRIVGRLTIPRSDEWFCDLINWHFAENINPLYFYEANSGCVYVSFMADVDKSDFIIRKGSDHRFASQWLPS